MLLSPSANIVEIGKNGREERLQKRPQTDYHDFSALSKTAAWKKFEAAWALRNIAFATEHAGVATVLIVKLLASPTDDIMQAVTDDLCPQLLKLLRLSGHRTLLLIPDLPRADQIFPGDDIQTQSVINADTIGSLLCLMENNLQLLSVIDAVINSLFRLMKDKRLLLVIDADIIGSLVRLMKDNNLLLLVLPLLNEILISSSEEDVLRVACWALSYISDDRDDFQAILDSGVSHNNLGKLLWCPSNSVLYFALRTVINIFAGSDRHIQSANTTINAASVISLVRLMNNRQLLEKRVLPFLKEKVISSTDEDVLRVACWALSCISDDGDYIAAILDAVGHQLVKLLDRSSNSVLYPVIRTVRNVFGGYDSEIQFMIDRKALTCLKKILKNSCSDIRLEACLAVSNITHPTRSRRHIKSVVEAGIIAELVHLLENSESDVDIRIRAASVIVCVTDGDSDGHINKLLAEDCIKAMCNSFICPNRGLVCLCLRGLENFLKYYKPQKNSSRSRKVNDYAHVIDGFRVFEKIAKLKDIGSDVITKRAMRVLKTYHPDSANFIKMMSTSLLVDSTVKVEKVMEETEKEKNT